MGTSISQIFTVTTASLGVAPGPIPSLVPSGITSNSVILTWTPPTTGDAPFSYKVQQSPPGTPVWTDATGIIQTLTATITGLSAPTTYQFQVIVYNGTSSNVSPTVSVTTIATLPGPPLNLAVVGVPAATSVGLQWTPPNNPAGTPPLTYNVSYRTPPGSGAFTPGPTGITGTGVTVPDLLPATSYDFEVSATNGAGTGPQSVILSSVSTSQGSLGPTAPQNLVLTALSPTQAQATWSASNGSGTINYILQYRPH